MKTYRLEANGIPMDSRRVASAPAVGSIAVGNGMVWNRRLPPSITQFSGVVEVGDPGIFAARVVQLRLRTGEVIDETRSDPATGAFVFLGWYSSVHNYEFHVIGEGYVSRSFPALAPATVQWNGNPSIHPSVP